jgi:hypothetical protein
MPRPCIGKAPEPNTMHPIRGGGVFGERALESIKKSLEYPAPLRQKQPER